MKLAEQKSVEGCALRLRGWSCRLLVALSLLTATTSTQALDATAHIERAVELIETQQYRLARSFLDPALIAPRLNPGARSRAYYLRGFSYVAQGMFVSARKDYSRALEFNPANPVVLVELGQLYAQGRGVSQDLPVAFSFFEQAAEQDYDRGLFHVGNALLNGQGVDKNVPQAREFLTKAIEQGHHFAMVSLGASYREQHVASPDPALALEWYEKAVADGQTAALLSIGYMHANGELGEKNPERAVEFYQQAADLGLPAASVSLAHAYLTGAGIAKNVERAFQLYSEAAKVGVPSSFIGLGHMYETGLGVARDGEAAVAWYERSARLGSVDGMLRLVGYYLRIDTPEARLEALNWSRQAADSGGAQAHNDYAWQLATSKYDDLRNGTLALDQANKAVAVEESAAFLDTLAAAYAELGKFDLAIQTQTKAIEGMADDDALREDFENRLAQYERSQPWRE